MNGGYYRAGKWWQDEKLWKAAEGLETVMMPIAVLAMQDYGWNMSSMKDLSEEIKKVMAADYSYPIILDERGVICDGRHRVVHAYLDGVSEIPAITLRDDEFPEPDYDECEAVKRKEEGNDGMDWRL